MEQKEEISEVIPEGKVKTVDGRIIDRAKACFLLQQHPEHKDIFSASDNTIYHRSEAGTLRCINKHKPSKAARKALKRQRHNAPQPPLNLRGGE
mgnify:CR=1 FL=1